MRDPEAITSLTPEQLARLPKKVQQEIERLVANVNYYKDKAEAGPEDSDTFLDAFVPGEGKPLGKRARVLFHHGPGERDAVHVRVTREGEVEVHSQNGPLVIRPHSSNVVHVAAGGYR